jgi:hypothetical protein
MRKKTCQVFLLAPRSGGHQDDLIIFLEWSVQPVHSRMWVPLTKILKCLRRLPSESTRWNLTEGYFLNVPDQLSHGAAGTENSAWLST